jgi:hypothetical protein
MRKVLKKIEILANEMDYIAEELLASDEIENTFKADEIICMTESMREFVQSMRNAG